MGSKGGPGSALPLTTLSFKSGLPLTTLDLRVVRGGPEIFPLLYDSELRVVGGAQKSAPPPPSYDCELRVVRGGPDPRRLNTNTVRIRKGPTTKRQVYMFL